jgi:hypothetical protein
MAVLEALDALDENAALGLALATGWLAVLGIGLYQYRQGTRSRERFYMTISVGVFWLAFSLFQVATTLTGIVENGIMALAVGLFCAGVFTGVKWWRLRGGGTDTSARP